MVTRAEIQAEALTWVGSPYHHRACVKGVGVDCAYLLIGIARNLGIIALEWEPPFYSVQWHIHQQEELYAQILVLQGAVPIDVFATQPGDIQLFRWEAWQPAAHAAIVMPDNKIIHARYRQVVRHETMNAYYQAHCAGAYTWPGVQDG